MASPWYIPTSSTTGLVGGAASAVIDWRSKCFGPAQQGKTVAAVVAAGLRVSELPTPLLTLDAAAVEHNIGVMNTFLSAHGLKLAPHGKTTMAPQLWHRQLEAGAWAITVATPWQLRVAVAHGVRRIMHAGAMLNAADLRFVAEFLDSQPDARVLVWVDSVETAGLTSAGYPAGGRPLDVLVDRGAHGARTGARTLGEAVATARTVAAAPNLALAGVAAWEGSLEGLHGGDAQSIVERFCDGATETYAAVAGEGLLATANAPVLTCGGSMYFDIVADRFAAVAADGADVVLRSGCYLTHDDGEYAAGSPFGRTIPGEPLRPALHLWGQVVSRPEPELALVNHGRRDVAFDAGLPVPQAVRGRDRASADRALAGCEVTGLNDQHGYLRLDRTSDLRPGEVVRSGISHPCTTFDKWPMIPVIESIDQDDPRVLGAARTAF